MHKHVWGFQPLSPVFGMIYLYFGAQSAPARVYECFLVSAGRFFFRLRYHFFKP